MIKLKKAAGVLALSAAMIMAPNVKAEDSSYFDEYLTNGKLVIKSIYDKDIAGDIVGEYVYNTYKDFSLKYGMNEETYESYPLCNDDFTKCTFEKYFEDKDEYIEKELDLVWVYDKDVKTVVDNILKKVPEDGKVFKLNDIETLKYIYSVLKNDKEIEGFDDIVSPMTFSSEFKNFIGYKNFVFEPRMGFSTPFSEFVAGTASFKYDDTIYAYVDRLGARLNMVLYVDDDESDIEKALNERLSKYFDNITIKKSNLNKNQVVNKYIDDEVEIFDACMSKIAEHEANEPVFPQQEENESYDDYMLRINEYNQAMSNWWSESSQIMVGDTYCSQFQNGNYQTADDYREHIEYLLFEEENQNQKVLDYLDDVIDDTYLVSFGDDFEFTFFVEKNSKKVYDSDISFVSNDVSTGVEVSAENNFIPLDTLIKVAKLTNGETFERIIKILNETNVEMFDLKLFSKSADNYITKLDNGSFEVRIPISDKFKDKDLIVYYVDDKENIEAHEVKISEDGAYAIFTTNHFSIYTLAQKVEDDSTTNPNTLDNISKYFALLILSGVGLITIKLSTKENN